MATGFERRFKGRVGIVWGSLYQSDGASAAPFINAGVPTNGTSGTLAGIAPVGALLIDTTNAVTYQNTGTQANPTWTQLGTGANVAITGGTITGVSSVTATTITAVGLFQRSVSTGLTAIGTTRAGALALTSEINVIATAAAGTGVSLGTLSPGMTQTIYNDGSSTVHVYAPGATTIDGTAGSTGVSLSATKGADFVATASTTVRSNTLGAVSS